MISTSNNSSNRFDSLKIDVKTLYKKFPLRPNSFSGVKGSQQEIRIFNELYHLPLLPQAIANGLWYVFHRTNLDQVWFDEFKKYWHHVLGGLTLWGPQDFYFLRNLYRLKFQQTKLSNVKSAHEHLKSWQNPEILYQLLDMVYRESLFNQVPALQLYLKYRKNDTEPIYEFGCGTAPVTTSFFEFINDNRIKIYLSDIQTIFFHYSAYKFRNKTNVLPILLTPEEYFMPNLSEQIGTIFCMTVFEHLNEPLAVVKKFHELLLPGGLLIFDYIKSEGNGMDTLAAVRQRGDVLHFINSKFHILHGSTEEMKEAKTIVARKRI